MIKVAFIATPEVEIGLLVAINSLCEHVSQEVEFHVLVERFSVDGLDRLRRAAGRHRCVIHDLSELDLGGGRHFYGQAAPYALFYVPELAGGDVLYIDCDMLVLLDVSEAFEIRPELAAAATYVPIAQTGRKEREFLQRFLPSNSPEWNTGVVLFNYDAWVGGEWRERCFAFAAAHPEELRAADQTVFNVVVADQATRLPDRFNTPTWAAASDPENSIVHFLGAPKPWHPFAARLSPRHVDTYGSWLERTPIPKRTSALKTIYKYRRPYARALLGAMKRTLPKPG